MTEKTRKLIIGGTATFLCATLMMGGALAWQDFSQHAVNRFRGSVDHDVTLHDDFDGINKDVYVENSGESTIYVRVRLDEYMQIGNTNMLGQDITDDEVDDLVTAKTKSSWLPHKYVQAEDGNIADCGQSDVDGGIMFHSYYDWDMSGAQIRYDPGTPGLVSQVLDGTKKDDDGNEITDDYGNAIPAVDAEKGANLTLGTSKPITMARYIQLKEAEETRGYDSMQDNSKKEWDGVMAGCWILDEDGWAYWSQPLNPNTATNLLLDQVKLKDGIQPTDDWFYGIDVKLQGVSLDETTTTWKNSGDYSDSAAKLIATWKA